MFKGKWNYRWISENIFVFKFYFSSNARLIWAHLNKWKDDIRSYLTKLLFINCSTFYAIFAMLSNKALCTMNEQLSVTCFSYTTVVNKHSHLFTNLKKNGIRHVLFEGTILSTIFSPLIQSSTGINFQDEFYKSWIILIKILCNHRDEFREWFQSPNFDSTWH